MLKQEAVKVRAAAEADSRERRYELQRHLERRSSQREIGERKLEALERREKSLIGREKEIHVKEKQLQRLEDDFRDVERRSKNNNYLTLSKMR